MSLDEDVSPPSSPFSNVKPKNSDMASMFSSVQNDDPKYLSIERILNKRIMEFEEEWQNKK